jgi:hypothetical protein
MGCTPDQRGTHSSTCRILGAENRSPTFIRPCCRSENVPKDARTRNCVPSRTHVCPAEKAAIRATEEAAPETDLSARAIKCDREPTLRPLLGGHDFWERASYHKVGLSHSLTRSHGLP